MNTFKMIRDTEEMEEVITKSIEKLLCMNCVNFGKCQIYNECGVLDLDDIHRIDAVMHTVLKRWHEN